MRIDGYHRREAAKRLALLAFPATVHAFGSLEAVVEAAFQANLAHGQFTNQQTHSAYSYWPFKHHPDLPQTQITKRVGVISMTVNIALKRRVEQEQRPHRSREKLLRSCFSTCKIR